MPKLVDMIPVDDQDGERHLRAQEFWNNASAYALQSAPYAVERIQQLDGMADEIASGMQFVPPEVQQKIFKKLKQDLIDPVENNTAEEYDAAWGKLKNISEQLHQDLMPSMQQMQSSMDTMPQGPHTMPDGTMMAP